MPYRKIKDACWEKLTNYKKKCIQWRAEGREGSNPPPPPPEIPTALQNRAKLNPAVENC